MLLPAHRLESHQVTRNLIREADLDACDLAAPDHVGHHAGKQGRVVVVLHVLDRRPGELAAKGIIPIIVAGAADTPEIQWVVRRARGDEGQEFTLAGGPAPGLTLQTRDIGDVGYGSRSIRLLCQVPATSCDPRRWCASDCVCEIAVVKVGLSQSS